MLPLKAKIFCVNSHIAYKFLCVRIMPILVECLSHARQCYNFWTS